MRFAPHEYQLFGLSWLIQRTIVEDFDGAGLLQDPGLGKTVQTLCWINMLRKVRFADSALIVAPRRVVFSVWPKEIEKWDQFRDWRVETIHGSEVKKLKAVSTPAEIYLCTTDGIKWIAQHYARKRLPWEVLVVDESTAFKNWGSARTKALRRLAPLFEKRLILTGTPVPKSLVDIFPQAFICDLGEALGKKVTHFRDRFCYRGGFKGYDWIPHESAMKAIQDKVRPMFLQMSAEDHLDMPELVINDVWVRMPPQAERIYKKMEEELFLELDSGEEMTPVNAGSRYNACKQIAAGGIYEMTRAERDLLAERRSLEEGRKIRPADIPIEVLPIHGAKIEALQELISELNGKPAMIAFQYTHDVTRLRQIWKDLPVIAGSTSDKETDKLIDEWNAGSLERLAVQPQSLSHGINMQSGPGRDIIFLGLTDDLEKYLQLIARIYRQGATGQVRVHRILCEGTVDELMRERTEEKQENQTTILTALNRYKERKRNQ